MTAHRIGLFPENDTTNGWAAHLPPRAPRPALAGDVAADWIVVGAGWAGLAAARRLAENRPSDRIVIIDAAAASDGASGRNSGFAIDLPHTIGGSADENEGALGYMRLARAGIASLKEQIAAHGIGCDWREQGKYQAAVTERGVAEYLEPFAAALARLGEPFEWIEGPELAARLGTNHFTRAVYTPGGALMNPVALVRGLADSLPANVELYEHTPAVSVEYANGTRIETPEGTIRAPQCILAVNGFAPGFGAFANRVLPMAAQASLTRPMTETEQAAYGVAEDWGMTPANSFVGITMRYTPDRRILIRERIRYRPGMRVTESERRMVTERHQRLFDARFPMLRGVEIAHTWSGFVALTRNSAPGFGRVRGGVHAACFQNAIGVTKGTIGGLLAADLACGRDNPLLADMEGLGTPSALPPAPALGLGVRARLAWELWRWRSEA